MEIGMQFIHRYNKNLSCIILDITNKGWKVQQKETFANSKKKAKETIQYYQSVWFDADKGIWEQSK